MSESPKVSILCTAFNHEEYIAEALESFISQKTDFSFEVLVTDDASTDKTSDIISDYASKYPDIIRYFHQSENLFSRGINIYREIMFPNARGEYIAYCEGDDYFCSENKLQLQADFLDANPEYSACVHNSYYHYCNSDRPDELLVPAAGDRDIPFETVIQGLHKSFHTSSFFARREFMLNQPDFYDTAFSYGFTDYAIALWLELCGKIRFIDAPMSVYRLSSNADAWTSGIGRSYGKKTRFVEGEIAMMEKLLPHLEDSHLIELTENEKLKRNYELLYLEGRVEDLVKPPYDKLYKSEPLSFRIKTGIKRCFPGLHNLYRNRKGYGN